MPHNTPFSDKKMAVQILAYRHSQSRAIRAGAHLPFHKAFDFFSLQQCSRPHDKVFGLLGFTNSRISVDYTTSIMEMFMSILADYLLALKFLTAKRGRFEMFPILISIQEEASFFAPFLAFGLNPFDPVVHLVSREILGFFAPGWVEQILDKVHIGWWTTYRNSPEKIREQATFWLGELESRSFFSILFHSVKLVWKTHSAWVAQKKESKKHQKVLAEKNSVMTAPYEGGEEKTHDEWVATARKISEAIWEQYQQSGETALSLHDTCR